MERIAGPSPHDRLVLVRALFFLALVALINLVVLASLWPAVIGQPFRTALLHELSHWQTFCGPALHARASAWADQLYDRLVVIPGLERALYGWFYSRPDLPGSERLWAARDFGPMLDNLFDYLLLLCHRAATLALLTLLAGPTWLALAGDGLLRRARRRYGFGDSALLPALWSRAALQVLLPVATVVLLMPMALPPLLPVLAVLALWLALLLALLTLPKHV